MHRAQDLASQARAFHWPLEFPDIMAGGGFDLVLGNPPWERIKLQEQEFFAAREPEIAEAPNAAARRRRIAKLEKAPPGSREHALYEEFESTKRMAEAFSVFARVADEDGGRFPLTGCGDVNTYALFAELFVNLTSAPGRAGIVVPTGIATDGTTARFFAALIDKGRLIRIASFENEEFIFPSVHHSYRFCLMTLGNGGQNSAPVFSFFLRRVEQISETERSFTLSAKEIARINPNTKTAPVFRSQADANLTVRIYERVPVLVDDSKGLAGNPWAFDYMTKMFDMADSSAAFRTAEQLHGTGLKLVKNRWTAKNGQSWVPLYEAKMIHQYDHRWGTYDTDGESRDSTLSEKQDPAFEPMPRYWVPERYVADRLATKAWTREWLLGWRDITSAHVLRTTIATAYPAFAIGHTIRNLFVIDQPRLAAGFIAGLSSLTFDFIARQKLGGTHLTVEILKQLPVLPPSRYNSSVLNFIVPRVLELAYTSDSMAPFARDLGYDGPPFAWVEDRRAQLCAELDAWYAHAYGLARDELRYVLDPADIKGPDYPSETFRVLKHNEIARFGEYRTARLVLAAYDELTKHPLAAE